MSDYQFDLQRFGGGNNGKGSKMLFTVLGFGIGLAFGPGLAMFSGAGQALTAGIYGASIASTLWSVTNKQNTESDYSSSFDKLQNTADDEAVIPVIYGKRRWAGNQTWHKTVGDDAKELIKDIIIGEGEIDSISQLTANDLPVTPTGSDGFVICKIKNVAYSDATMKIETTNSPTGDDKLLTLYANGITNSLILASSNDVDEVANQYSYDLTKLISYVDTLGNGWTVVDPCYISIEPEKIYNVSLTTCYNAEIPLRCDALDNCTYSFYNGSSSQSPPDNYAVVGSYKNCAWTRIDLHESDELTGGNPNITCLVKGKKVKIFSDSTNYTTAWSDNPAWCIRDFLTNKRYGLGRWVTEDMIDIQSFLESAAYCDETVSYQDPFGVTRSHKRYSLNIILAQQQSALNHLSDMSAVFGGFITVTDGMVSLKVEKAESVSYAFDDNTIIKDSVSFTQYSLDETPNQYKIGYFDAAQAWGEIKCLSEDLADQKFRGKIISKEVTLSGCTDQAQALRLGRLYRDLNKLCPTVIDFSVSTHAMHLEPGDIVTVSWNNVFTDAPFRIQEIHQANGTFKLICRQYNASIYNDRLDAEITTKTYTNADSGLAKPKNVTNLTATEYHRTRADGSINNQVELNWETNISNFDHCEVWMQCEELVWNEVNGKTWNNISGTWNKVGSTIDKWVLLGDATNNYVVNDLVVGNTYHFKIVSVNKKGLKSIFDTSSVVTHKVVGKSTTAQIPKNLMVTITNECTWTWDYCTDGDIEFYELRTDQQPGSSTNLLAKVPKTTNSVKVTPPNRSGVVYLYSNNSIGYSATPARCLYTKTKPSAPTLTVEEVFRGLKLSVGELPTYCSGVDFYVEGVKYFSPNNIYSCKLDAGIYSVYAAYVDVFGDGEYCSPQTITVLPYIDPKFIGEESLALEKMDSNFQAALINNSAILSSFVSLVGDAAAYSGIAQVSDDIQLRVKDANGSLSLVNISPNTITLDGKYVHITGDTKIDNNLIVENMIRAGAVSADKIAAGAITTDKLAADAITADKIAAGAITANKIQAGSIDAGLISQNGISLANLMKECWMPCWKYYKWDGTGNWYDSNQYTRSYGTSVPSLGALHFQYSMPDYIMFEMKIKCPSSVSASQFLMNVDDDMYIFLNGNQTHYYGSGSPNVAITHSFPAGESTLQIFIGDVLGGAIGLVLLGDIINGTSIRFNG